MLNSVGGIGSLSGLLSDLLNKTTATLDIFPSNRFNTSQELMALNDASVFSSGLTIYCHLCALPLPKHAGGSKGFLEGMHLGFTLLRQITRLGHGRFPNTQVQGKRRSISDGGEV